MTTGAALWLAWRYSNQLRTSDARADGGTIAARDELRHSLSELRQSRDLMGRILETMRESVLVIDAKNRIVLHNRALGEMILSSGDFSGRPLIEIVRSAELQNLLEETRAAGSKTELEFDLAGIRPRRLLVQSIPLVGDRSDLLLVVVDVTEMRRLETLRRDFVANVSHELKTPVTAIRSAAETLRDGAIKDPEHAPQFVDMIERNAQRLQSLVEDLLELSRIESRALQLDIQNLSLTSAVASAMQLFGERAAKKQMRLTTVVPEDLLVRADKRAFEQVLSNLIDNAVKYCPAGSEVTVKAVPSGDEVQISVADQGAGIPPKHLPRVFERFYRVDSGRAREVGGTGLGLSIVKHLTEAMAGNATVESEFGAGTTFIVTLPRA